MSGRFSNFDEFWPFYVAEHARSSTRWLHFIGTTLLAPILVLAIFKSAWWLVGLPLVGYGFAWAGHFFCEHNRPATFTHPLWSLRGDFRMYRLMWLGRMNAEVERHAGPPTAGAPST